MDMPYVCPYCGEPMAEAQSACCGKAGRPVEDAEYEQWLQDYEAQANEPGMETMFLQDEEQERVP